MAGAITCSIRRRTPSASSLPEPAPKLGIRASNYSRAVHETALRSSVVLRFLRGAALFGLAVERSFDQTARGIRAGADGGDGSAFQGAGVRLCEGLRPARLSKARRAHRKSAQAPGSDRVLG